LTLEINSIVAENSNRSVAIRVREAPDHLTRARCSITEVVILNIAKSLMRPRDSIIPLRIPHVFHLLPVSTECRIVTVVIVNVANGLPRSTGSVIQVEIINIPYLLAVP
jgi:hypothetical protein